jgi:hypothetical protein
MQLFVNVNLLQNHSINDDRTRSIYVHDFTFYGKTNKISDLSRYIILCGNVL